MDQTSIMGRATEAERTGPGRRRSSRRSATKRIAAAAGAVITCGVLLTGCTGAEEPVVIGDEYTGAGAGELSVDGPGDTSPAVGWVEPGESFFVTTYGSSSCPAAPTGIAVDGGDLVVEMTMIGGEVCSADYGPTSYALDLPEPRDPAETVGVTLQFDDDDVSLALTP